MLTSDCQHGGSDCHPAIVGCSFFRYTNDDLSDLTNQRHQHKIWTREDNKLAFHSYFNNNPTQSMYRKRMIVIREECVRLQTTSQRLANQVRTIIKKVWFSNLEIREIRKKINRESRKQDPDTISDTLNIDSQEYFKRNETQANNNRNTTHPKYTEQTLIQEEINLECTTWTLTKRLEKKLDGNYTRMLRAILNKSWQQHPTRHQLYGHLPPITKTIQVRRTRHAGHCWRSRDELIRDVLLWIPTHIRAKAGRPAGTYIQQLCEDTGCCPEDLPRAMNDREEWRERVRDIRATSVIWWWWWWDCHR